jgi:hypothetical protein
MNASTLRSTHRASRLLALPRSAAMRAAPVVALVLALLATGSARASAQVLDGRVLDGETRAPLADARLALIDDDGTEVSEPSVTGSDGAFNLSAPGAGGYYIKIEREGYTPIVDGVFEFVAANGRMSLDAFMLPRPVDLEGIDVRIDRERARLRLRRGGFYERVVAGFGTFVTPEQIEMMGLRANVSEYLRSVPGITINQGLVLFKDAAGGRFLSGGGGQAIEGCAPNIWIDGSRTVKAADRRSLTSPAPGAPLDTGLSANDLAQGLDDLVQPESVVAIEVYTSPAETPIEFGGMNGSCGTIVVWTKTGG